MTDEQVVNSPEFGGGRHEVYVVTERESVEDVALTGERVIGWTEYPEHANDTADDRRKELKKAGRDGVTVDVIPVPKIPPVGYDTWAEYREFVEQEQRVLGGDETNNERQRKSWLFRLLDRLRGRS